MRVDRDRMERSGNDNSVDIIQILDLKKASDPDKISHKILKIAPEKIAEPPQIIFNKSLRQGKYPSSWNIAHRDSYFKKM